MSVVTDDRGTDMLNAGGKVAAAHGFDRHDEMVEKYEGKAGASPGTGRSSWPRWSAPDCPTPGWRRMTPQRP